MGPSDPYLILGMDEHVTDAEVTAAYHTALRRFPPEHAPETFARISEAYETIRREADRVRHRLFPTPIPCAELPAYFEALDTPTRIPSVKQATWLREARRHWMRNRLP